MEEAGLIRGTWATKDNGRRLRVYDLTARGRKELAKEELRLTSVASAVQRVLRLA
jgi:DNA-binding PadR family transcriptional regulator